MASYRYTFLASRNLQHLILMHRIFRKVSKDTAIERALAVKEKLLRSGEYESISCEKLTRGYETDWIELENIQLPDSTE